jgi:TolA-binding protein
MPNLENKKKSFLGFFKNLDQLSYKMEVFFQKHKKKISISLLSILILFGAYFAYQKGYLEPREEKALNLFYNSRDLFSKNYEIENSKDLQKALGDNPKEAIIGFIDIIKKYPSTKAANLAHFYAGLTFYKLKKYEKALEHFKSFSCKDAILPSTKEGLIGDCLSELNKKEEALYHYLKAAKEGNNNEFNEVLYYQKAALISFSMEKYKETKEYLELIQKKYPKAKTSINLDKYLALSNLKLSKRS